MFPTNSIPFHFLFFKLFVGISFGVPSYHWDSASTVHNVHTFAKFIDDLYTGYSKTSKMDTIFQRVLGQQFLKNCTNKQKRAVFNFTFVKCAAEIAHLRVINAETDGERPFRNLNVVSPASFANTLPLRAIQIPFVHYDQSLGQQIANAFEREIFSPAKEQKIAKTVANQIMQLAFSFAVRVLLYVIDDAYYNRFGTGEWQLRTLLSAFKILSAQNGANIVNGIFSFPIIQIDEGGNHLWKQQMLSSNGNKKEQQDQTQHIKNFKFILRLSDVELTQYKIVKVLDQIIGANDALTPPPAIYTFIMDHFRTFLAPYGNQIVNNQSFWLDCAMVNFGLELAKRFSWDHNNFLNYYRRKSEKCGKDVHQKMPPSNNNMAPFIADNNTPQKDSNQTVMRIFNEPVWNYVQVINVDRSNANINTTKKQFCDDLHNVVAAVLAEKNEDKIKNLKHTKEFKIFCSVFNKTGMSSQIKNWSNNYDEKISKNEKIVALKELQKISVQMSKEYRQAKTIFQNGKNEMQSFGQLFYESLQKYNGDKVRYDEQRQLLTFPAQIGERLISRLGTFVEKNLPSNAKENDIDFVSAMDAIASSRDNLESQQRICLAKKDNMPFFRLLFTLALRLGWQMEEQKDFAEKYLLILHANMARFINDAGIKMSENFVMPLSDDENASDENTEPEPSQPKKKCRSFSMKQRLETIKFAKKNSIHAASRHFKIDRKTIKEWSRDELCSFSHVFINKINVEQNLVRINLPNWNMPYLVYLKDENELIEQKATKTFEFWLSLADYSPTLFEIVKMAKILYKINEENGHISIEQSSDPELFLFILKRVSAKMEDLDGMNEQMLKKLKIEGESSAGKTELSVENSFCFLSHFVVQLLEKAIDEAEYLLNIEIVNVFINQTKTICTEENIKEETMEIFGANVVNIGRKIKIDFNLRADIQQKVLPDLIDELETMINNENWNCVNLKHLREVEWVFLENGLMGNRQSDEWKKIKKLMDEWTTEYNKAFSEGKRLNFQKTVEELKAKLGNLKEEK